MSDSPDRTSFSQRQGRKVGSRTRLGGIATILLVGAYWFAAPQLNERFGWNLPEITADQEGKLQVADSDSGGQNRAAEQETAGPAESASSPPTAAEKGKQPEVPSADAEPEPDGPASVRGPPKRPVAPQPVAEPSEDRLYGLLREVSPDRFLSPAGLLYTPGSAEGHRLEHLRRHIKDDPARPGYHGVFDGEMEGALATIDRAYERAKKDQRTTKKVDGSRTIYTVDMGSRVGYVGGREGGRKRKPMARRVRLVVEGNRLITAYPL